MKFILFLSYFICLTAIAEGQHTYMRDAARERNKINNEHGLAPAYKRKGGNIHEDDQQTVAPATTMDFSRPVKEPEGDEDGPFPFHNSVGEFGYKDLNDSLVIGCKYDSVSLFYEGYAIVSVGHFPNSLSGVINKKGESKVIIRYSSIIDMHDGYFYVTKDNNKGVIDKEENIVVPVIYKDLIPHILGNYFMVTDQSNDKWHYYPEEKIARRADND